MEKEEEEGRVTEKEEKWTGKEEKKTGKNVKDEKRWECKMKTAEIEGTRWNMKGSGREKMEKKGI